MRKTMGRWYWDKKDTVEDCRTVSIAFLRKNDFLCGWRSGTIIWKNWYGEKTASIGVTVCAMDGENYARFQYTHTLRSTGEKTECDYRVQLVTTPCHLGGVRKVVHLSLEQERRLLRPKSRQAPSAVGRQILWLPALL